MAKVNFNAGKYELIREELGLMSDGGTIDENKSIKLDLTAAQAKTLMVNHFYEKLGFKSIEFLGTN